MAPAAASEVAGRGRPRLRCRRGTAAAPATVVAASARAHVTALALFGELDKGIPHWSTIQ